MDWHLIDWHLIESLGLGLGLGIAAGFRVVVPFWVLSLAALVGHVPLADTMQWLDSYTAFLALSIALVVELLAYSIPWLDNVMDAVAFPLAAIAGTLLMALAANQLDPLAQWSLAIVAGGGAAATVKGVHGLTRFLSTATSGGITNFLVAIAELLGALLFSVLSLVAPLLVWLGVLIGLAGLGVLILKAFNRPPQPSSEP